MLIRISPSFSVAYSLRPRHLTRQAPPPIVSSRCVQFDPPQDPSSFIHRVGRTARMGREGQAIVYLLPEEDTYAEFLRLRKVPLLELPKTTGLAPVTENLRTAAAADRDVLEKATRAMVSFVRGYKEHQCKYIFR